MKNGSAVCSGLISSRSTSLMHLPFTLASRWRPCQAPSTLCLCRRHICEHLLFPVASCE